MNIEYKLWSAEWDVGNWDPGWGSPKYVYMVWCEVVDTHDRDKRIHYFCVEYDPGDYSPEDKELTWGCACLGDEKPTGVIPLRKSNTLDGNHCKLYEMCLHVLAMNEGIVEI